MKWPQIKPAAQQRLNREASESMNKGNLWQWMLTLPWACTALQGRLVTVAQQAWSNVKQQSCLLWISFRKAFQHGARPQSIVDCACYWASCPCKLCQHRGLPLIYDSGNVTPSLSPFYFCLVPCPSSLSGAVFVDDPFTPILWRFLLISGMEWPSLKIHLGRLWSHWLPAGRVKFLFLWRPSPDTYLLSFLLGTEFIQSSLCSTQRHSFLLLAGAAFTVPRAWRWCYTVWVL